MKQKETTTTPPSEQETSRFKITRGKIQGMYAGDRELISSLNKTKSASSRIGQVDYDSLENAYYNLNSLDTVRQYSSEAYTFYPVYKHLIDARANMFQYKYIFTPRAVKDKANPAIYGEIYQQMASIVDGISIETVFPMCLTKLFVAGGVYLYAVKNNSSQTIRTLCLNEKYCRRTSLTQYGTYTYQFNFKYFEDLGLSTQELELAFESFPPEFRVGYDAYKKDAKNMQWQVLDPRFATAIQENEFAFPTSLKAIFSMKQYDEYLAIELERSSQTLEKIITHKMPTWQDKLVIEIDEMAELHKSISRVLAKNKYVRLITSFGDIDVKQIGREQSQENKTLLNAYNAIYNLAGENSELWAGSSTEALNLALLREESMVFNYIQQLVNFYNIAINNLYNFKGYQCDIEMLPVTVYNYRDRLEVYRQSATLGVGKLEFVVASGTKQSHIMDKFALEDFLGLDQLKPLSVSYTQGDSVEKNREAAEEETTTSTSTEETPKEEETIQEEQEVEPDAEENTN